MESLEDHHVFPDGSLNRRHVSLLLSDYSKLCSQFVNLEILLYSRKKVLRFIYLSLKRSSFCFPLYASRWKPDDRWLLGDNEIRKKRFLYSIQMSNNSKIIYLDVTHQYRGLAAHIMAYQVFLTPLMILAFVIFFLSLHSFSLHQISSWLII